MARGTATATAAEKDRALRLWRRWTDEGTPAGIDGKAAEEFGAFVLAAARNGLDSLPGRSGSHPGVARAIAGVCMASGLLTFAYLVLAASMLLSPLVAQIHDGEVPRAGLWYSVPWWLHAAFGGVVGGVAVCVWQNDRRNHPSRSTAQQARAWALGILGFILLAVLVGPILSRLGNAPPGGP